MIYCGIVFIYLYCFLYGLCSVVFSFRREREFKVSIKFAAKADIHHLKEFLRSRQSDAPQETIQALDVVLRTTPAAE